MTSVPYFLREIHPALAQAILTSYEEDGISPTSLDLWHVVQLLSDGFMQFDPDRYLVVTAPVRSKLDNIKRL